MKKLLIAAFMTTAAFGNSYASESAMEALKAQVPPSVLENSAVRPPLDPPAFRRYLAEQGIIKLDYSKRAHKTTWSTLTILQFIPKTVFSKAGGLIVDDGQGTWAGHMAAARQIDMVFVEIRGAERVGSMDQVATIARALSGKRMTVREFADLMDAMYVFYDNTSPAAAKASKAKSAMICIYNGKQLAHSGSCQEAVMEYQIENEGYSFELDTGGSRGNCYLNDAAGHRVRSVHESYCGLTDADFAPGGKFGRPDDGGNSHPED